MERILNQGMHDHASLRPKATPKRLDVSPRMSTPVEISPSPPLSSSDIAASLSCALHATSSNQQKNTLSERSQQMEEAAAATLTSVSEEEPIGATRSQSVNQSEEMDAPRPSASGQSPRQPPNSSGESMESANENDNNSDDSGHHGDNESPMTSRGTGNIGVDADKSKPTAACTPSTVSADNIRENNMSKTDKDSTRKAANISSNDHNSPVSGGTRSLEPTAASTARVPVMQGNSCAESRANERMPNARSTTPQARLALIIKESDSSSNLSTHKERKVDTKNQQRSSEDEKECAEEVRDTKQSEISVAPQVRSLLECLCYEYWFLSFPGDQRCQMDRHSSGYRYPPHQRYHRVPRDFFGHTIMTLL